MAKGKFVDENLQT